MKKEIGKLIGEKNWRNFKLILLLLGIVLAANSVITAQSECDPTQFSPVTRVSIAYAESQTAAWGYARYDILRNGETDHYIHLFYDAPDNTVFKAYFNGVEVATLVRHPTSNFGEYWSYEGYGVPHSVGHVGDVMSVTKDGQPFVTGTYTREPVDYEAADGFIQHGNPYPCTIYRGALNLPTSANPRTLRSAVMLALAPNPITRITLNEPSEQTGIPGPEIAQIPISSSGVFDANWYKASIVATNTVLTETQFSLLRQGLISVTIYTAQHPNGYSQVALVTQGINSGSDFEGDGIADLAVFRPSEQNWYLQFSSNNQTQTVNFGSINDKLVVGDYDSDNKADITTFQTDNPNYPGKGVWQILRSSDGSVRTIQWGLNDDIPVGIDIDNNNTTDMGVFRPSNGTWYIRRSGDIIKPLAFAEFGGQQNLAIRWGTAGDRPLAGDFNGDLIDELVVFRPSEGNWYIYDHVNNSYQILHWGLGSDIPMARDFDGDRRADLAVYRPSEGNWYIYGSLEHSLIVRRFGLDGDVPVPADFDKDSVADIAVFRPSNGTWYVTRSSNNTFFAVQFGLNGDIPAITPR